MVKPVGHKSHHHAHSPQESGIGSMFKSLYNRFLFSYYRYCGPSELRHALKRFEEIREKVTVLNEEANETIFKIGGAFKESISHRSDRLTSVSFLMKTAYNELTQNKAELEEIQRKRGVQSNPLLRNAVQREIAHITSKINELDKTARKSSIELGSTEKVGSQNSRNFQALIDRLSSVLIQGKTVNVASELIRKGINLSSFFLKEFPRNDDTPLYLRDNSKNKEKLDRIVLRLVRLYKALVDEESLKNPQEIEHDLLTLVGKGIDSSDVLHTLILHAEDEVSEGDPNREMILTEKLALKIQKNIPSIYLKSQLP